MMDSCSSRHSESGDPIDRSRLKEERARIIKYYEWSDASGWDDPVDAAIA